MHKLILFLVLPLLLSACNQNQPTADPPVNKTELAREALTAQLDSIQQNGKIPGFAVGIANADGTLYAKGFGYADIATKKPYTEHTVQPIASVSKTLIGIALMKAREMGKLKLDDPIQQYLPFQVGNPNHPDQVITIWHLATHTSGINDTDEYMNRSWIIRPGQDLTGISTDYPEQRLNPTEADIPLEQYLKGYLEVGGDYYLPENYTEFAAGERYNYSNIGATVAALVIEKATGQAYDAFTREHILAPLKMNDTGWALEEIDPSQHATLYRNDDSVLPLYSAITYPDGMLLSSSNDMAKYLTELIKGFSGTGTLLSQESYEELFTVQLDESHQEDRNPDNPYDEDYDPAIFMGHSALGYVGHSGGDAGVATWMFINKKTKTGRYIVINTDMGNDERARELEYYAAWDALEAFLDGLDDE
ncbi:serine hydrolase domain-containing protein [Neolewinella persica]|uniref:serine hydrolase domain-containing protein n=1 Tax=Neolewinella persica TaxID=70998 RepID=UPI00035C68EF|nr:serine hydrolase domain-containing protein [Neolewinella persica]